MAERKYKIVCVTPAGRRRYMRILIPQILACPLVDRYDIWLNTTDQNDISFFYKLSEIFDKIRIVEQPEGKVDGIKSINAFFKAATETDTIYIRLDDDIVWIEPDFFQKIVKFRIENPQYFLVAPLIINNALCTHILQNEKKIECTEYVRADVFDATGWRSDKFALSLHRWFLNKLAEKSYTDIYCGRKPIALNRFSINCIAWFGETFQNFDGVVLEDEEEFVTVTKPLELGMVNCFYCDTVIAHFAFFTQRRTLDKTTILSEYAEIADNTYAENPCYLSVKNNVSEILHSVGADTYEEQKEYPYKLSIVDKMKRRLYKSKVPIVKLVTLGQLKKNLFNSRIKRS
jgi:hypothetical protein